MWMLIVVMLLVGTALGVARVGGASGDYVRRQVAADASVLAGARVLEERLGHIARLQRLGQETLEGGDSQAARQASEAARLIADGTPAAVRSEVQSAADGNGAARWDLQGTDGTWFVEVPSGQPELSWVGLGPGFETRRLTAVLWHPTLAGEDRPAYSSAWVEGGGVGGPLIDDHWRARRVPTP